MITCIPSFVAHVVIRLLAHDYIHLQICIFGDAWEQPHVGVKYYVVIIGRRRRPNSVLQRVTLVQISVPPGGANWHPFSLTLQT